MLAKIRLTSLLLLMVACGSSDADDADIQAGDDISGDYRGCANAACTQLTPAGFRFYVDGKVALLQGSPPTDWPRECDAPPPLPEGCTFNDWTLCPAEDDPLFEQARWQWSEGGELVLSGVAAIPDLTLETNGELVEVPAHETEPGLIYLYPASYPDAEWMKRVSRSTDGCLHD